MSDSDGKAGGSGSGGAEEPTTRTSKITRTFRPALALRILAVAAGLACGVAAGWQVWLAATDSPGHLAAAGVLTFPTGLAAAILTRRVTVREEVLVSASLLGVRRVPWARITRLDRFRRSYVVETDSGPVSAGWLAEREDLLKLVVERARLGRMYEGLPWGVVERYVPRSRPIGFRPHHQRRGGDPPKEQAG